MTFFLTEIVARVVAAYLAIDCIRKLRTGLTEGHIRNFQPDWVMWIVNPSNPDIVRKTSPIRFWMEVITQAFLLAGCLFVAVVGWHVTK